MTAQGLPHALLVYRIGDPTGRYPIYDPTGAQLFPGRWNTAAAPIIYASRHLSTAMLEMLAHGNGQIPARQYFIEISIPAGVTYEVFSADHHPDWHREDTVVASAFGAAWYDQMRSAVLFVPSLVARIEQNVLINPKHPDAARIRPGLHQPLWWDKRLFIS